MPMSKMYSKSVMQWNPFVGCEFGCQYCKKSFQRMLKWVGVMQSCKKCSSFAPHTHPGRLTAKFPRTKDGEFIFTCSTGDISFCDPSYRNKILEVIRANPDRTFLIQSKNPGALKSVDFPENVILGTTLETNRVKEYAGVSKAPLPEQRFMDLLVIDHPKKMITIEPVIEFDPDIMKEWVRTIKPVMVWIGYDSRKSGLIEPATAKVLRFIEDLESEGFNVIPKLIRAPHPVLGILSPISRSRKTMVKAEQ